MSVIHVIAGVNAIFSALEMQLVTIVQQACVIVALMAGEAIIVK